MTGDAPGTRRERQHERAAHRDAGDGPLIPRPERTPDALRAACAVVAPQFLPAYDQAKDKALAEAVEHGSQAPVHACLRHWSALIEIERHPGTAKEYHRAEYLAQLAGSQQEAREHERCRRNLSGCGCRGGRGVSWSWEYVPDEETVASGAPPAFLAEVEKKADELVRAAEALHLHGATWQGADEGARPAVSSST